MAEPTLAQELGGKLLALHLRLPSGVPAFSRKVVLDGTTYALRFRWSMRETKWYLELRDEEGRLITGPMKLVVNFPLLDMRRAGREAPDFPAGELTIFDSRAVPLDPVLEDLGAQHFRLLYLIPRPPLEPIIKTDYVRDGLGRVIVREGFATKATRVYVRDYDRFAQPVVVDVIVTTTQVPYP